MKRLFILFIVIYPVYFAHPQEKLIIKGVVFQTDTNTLLDSVQISIYSRRVIVYSNKFGLFNILAVRGDTVEFSLKDYKTKTLVIKDTSALLVKLNRIVLKQVVIKGSSNRN